MSVGEGSVLTSSLTNEIATIPQRARTIDLVHTGASIITFIAN